MHIRRCTCTNAARLAGGNAGGWRRERQRKRMAALFAGGLQHLHEHCCGMLPLSSIRLRLRYSSWLGGSRRMRTSAQAGDAVAERCVIRAVARGSGGTGACVCPSIPPSLSNRVRLQLQQNRLRLWRVQRR